MKRKLKVCITPYDSVARIVKTRWQKAYLIVKRAFEDNVCPDVSVECNNSDEILITMNWSKYDWPTLVKKYGNTRRKKQ